MRNLLACVVLLLAAPAFGQIPAEIPLWAGVAPGSEGRTGDEVIEKSASGELRVTNVHRPSLTPYLPSRETATGVAVLVIPGGGHRQLVITHEGYNPAEWLRARGIAAFVLKHRLAREPNSTYRIDVEALADATRAMRLIRSRAAEWGIDPARVGAMGFSAGGELVAMMATRDVAGVTTADETRRRAGRTAHVRQRRSWLRRAGVEQETGGPVARALRGMARGPQGARAAAVSRGPDAIPGPHDQNRTLNAIWMLRSVVPHSAHDGLGSIAEIVPNAALPNWLFGCANCA
jgi:hypothetical protein